MAKFYTIKTPETVYMTSSYEDALQFSHKTCMPITESYTQIFKDANETPMKSKIKEEFGEVNSDTIHKYIISHPEEAGILFTVDAYNEHRQQEAEISK